MSTRIPLSPQARSYLKAEAHVLRPVVQIGKSGLSESVVREVASSISAHELIKVKVMADKEDKAIMAEEVAKSTSSALVEVLGNIIILFKPNKDPAKRKFKLPK